MTLHMYIDMNVQCLESQPISQMYLSEEISIHWLLLMLCLDLLMLYNFIAEQVVSILI
jgi:hypothetical protein